MRNFIIAILLGVATTYLISWLAMVLPRGNAWYGPRTVNEMGWDSETLNRLWMINRGENAWHEVVAYHRMQISGMNVSIPQADFDARAYDFRQLPSHFRPESLDDLTMASWYHAVGWPMHAVSCEVHWQTQVQNADILYTVAGGVQLPRDRSFNPRALPLRPIWPGFAINVLLYGLLWWLLLRMIAGFRSLRRARRGCCHACGYSRKGIAGDARCPECGCEALLRKTACVHTS
ncbi:MAG: hypothetical protein ACR2GY_08970 [Phycisphaerales bacterium]